MEMDTKGQQSEEIPSNEEGLMDRRGFLLGLKKWSKIVIGGALLGSALLNSVTEKEAEAAAWANRGGGGGAAWANRAGGGAAVVKPGGGAAVVKPGGGAVVAPGGGAWANRAGAGGAWANRGAAWANRGAAWVNRF
jgi:hypothetical protein